MFVPPFDNRFYALVRFDGAKHEADGYRVGNIERGACFDAGGEGGCIADCAEGYGEIAVGDNVDAVGVYAVAVLIGGISFLPGGVGSTEAVMTALLAARGYSVSQALLITLTCRLVTLWLAVGLGWVAVFALRQRTAPEVTPWP